MIKERNASKDIRKLNLESKAIYVQKGILFSAFYWVWLGLYLTSKREHTPTGAPVLDRLYFVDISVR